MSIDNSVTDYLTGGAGAKSALFPNVGDTHTGTIVSADVLQQTEYGTGAPKFWKDGDPMMHLRVIIATDERDADDPDDDGERAIYFKGSKKDPQSGAGALVVAMKAAKVNHLAVGAKLMVQYTGDRPSNMGNPAKQYRVGYKPPAPGADFFADDEPTTQAPAASAAAAQPDPFDEF